jgi:hypothetical protein
MGFKVSEMAGETKQTRQRRSSTGEFRANAVRLVLTGAKSLPQTRPLPDIRLHRSLLQPEAATLGPRLRQPGRVRARAPSDDRLTRYRRGHRSQSTKTAMALRIGVLIAAKGRRFERLTEEGESSHPDWQLRRGLVDLGRPVPEPPGLTVRAPACPRSRPESGFASCAAPGPPPAGTSGRPARRRPSRPGGRRSAGGCRGATAA